MTSWPVPRNTKEGNTIVGLFGYYCRFCPNYAKKSAPLNALKKKGMKFVWRQEHQEAFDYLKECMLRAHILGFPLAEGEFILDTDASNMSVGALLSQIQDNHEVVIAYGSKTLSKTQQNYCSTMKVLFAVFHFVTDVYQCYLYSQHFTVRTDHASLVWLRNFKKAEGILAR